MTTLLKSYEQASLLCNLSVCGATTKPDLLAYRGDMVLEEGDVADASGRRTPPKSVIKQAAVLVDRDKLKFVSGGLVALALLPLYVERYRADFAPDILSVFYVENLGKPLQTTLDGINIVLLPHTEGGAIWNTLMEELRLDKEDFKGQTPEDKVITVAKAFAGYKPKFGEVPFEQALTMTVTIHREARGPV